MLRGPAGPEIRGTGSSAGRVLGVNAYVVKPVDFDEFVNAIKELGVFWAIINEPPPGSVAKGR